VTRRSFDESEHQRTAKPEPIGGLFAPETNTAPASSSLTHEPTRKPSLQVPAEIPGWRTRWASLSDDERRAQRERWQESLLPIVQAMASVAAGDGITASDVISRGITAGILNGERAFLHEHPRVYSFVGLWLAQLVRDGVLAPKTVTLENGGQMRVRRESDRAVSKGNVNLVYVAAEVAA
jgi:hypothetical protein